MFRKFVCFIPALTRHNQADRKRKTHYLLQPADAVLGLRTIEEHEQGLLTRFGRHLRVLEPGLHLIIPLVDRLQRIDLREVSVIKRIEPEAVGRIRIGSEEWEARTHDRKGIGPGTPIRISPVEGQVMVVTAGT